MGNLIYNNAEFLPGEDGHGLLDVDVDVVLPRLPAVVQEVVTGEHVLPSRHSRHLAEIYNETFRQGERN